MHRLSIAAALAATVVLALAGTADAKKRNSGFYDHQFIQYTLATLSADSPSAAKQISKGLVVYHMVDSTGNTPAVQCARLKAALPQDNSDCNVLNRIPTEPGYTGGSWNLHIFHWSAGMTPVELSSDDDIEQAAANGWGTIETTSILIRCPVNDFSLLR
jgi:hypothetical protein